MGMNIRFTLTTFKIYSFFSMFLFVFTQNKRKFTLKDLALLSRLNYKQEDASFFKAKLLNKYIDSLKGDDKEEYINTLKDLPNIKNYILKFEEIVFQEDELPEKDYAVVRRFVEKLYNIDLVKEVEEQFDVIQPQKRISIGGVWVKIFYGTVFTPFNTLCVYNGYLDGNKYCKMMVNLPRIVISAAAENSESYVRRDLKMILGK